MKNLMMTSVLLLGAVVLTGCGSDDGDGDGGMPAVLPGVAGDTLVSDMSGDEAVEFCVSIYDAMLKATETVTAIMIDSLCPEEGVDAAVNVWFGDGSDEEIVAVCETTVQECEDFLAEAGEAGSEASDDARPTADICADAGSTIESCDVSVGEIADCINAVNSMTVASMNSVEVSACSDLSNDFFWGESENAAEPADGVETPEICETVLRECPGLETMGVSVNEILFRK